MRVAAGSFAGLMPITAGLAAANALPAPIQGALSSAFKTAGINIPTPTSGLPTDGGSLLADAPRPDGGADVGASTNSDEPAPNDDSVGDAAPHHSAPKPRGKAIKGANRTNPARSADGGHDNSGNGGGNGNGNDGQSGGAPSGGGQGNGGQGNGGQSGGAPSGGGQGNG